MNYRITIETEKPVDARGYAGWEEVYQQIVPELSVKSLVTHINNTRVRKRGKQHEQTSAGNG